MSEQIAEVMALTTKLSTDNLALWSDDKRNAFVETFDARIRVARFILVATADKIAAIALEKHYISEKHLRKLNVHDRVQPDDIYDKQTGDRNWRSFIGGRPQAELKQVAADRAKDIISSLPGLTESVRILSPKVAGWMQSRDRILEKGKELMEKAEELGAPIDMCDIDQEMSIGQFREMIKTREKAKIALLTKLDELGDEGRELEHKINKFLYDGLPGLSEAVIKVISDHTDRAKAFSGLNRRVSEQVRFGDSEAATELLKGFEKDESTVSSEIKAQFDAALSVLRLAAKNGKLTDGKSSSKQLSSGKKQPSKKSTKKR